MLPRVVLNPDGNCGAQNKPAHIAGVGNDDCGYVSFIARFSKEGKALYLNKLEATGEG